MDPKKVYLEETSKRKDVWRSGSEIALELTRLAAEIADGALIINGEKLPVGDSFSFVMKKQLKKGTVSCEFFLQTRVVEQALSPPVPVASDKIMQKFPASGGGGIRSVQGTRCRAAPKMRGL